MFKRPAKTSRGVYHTHKIWYVVVHSATNPTHFGIGECAPLVDLSCDYSLNYAQTLQHICAGVQAAGALNSEALRRYPSILFGLETALLHYQHQSLQLWDNAFTRGQAGIPVNGLIWMDDYNTMLEQIDVKLEAGFRCIKLKIGAIHFEEELKLLRHIRSRYDANTVTLRVDANGAFFPQEAQDKLAQLVELDIHSIEQPIRAGQWQQMAELTRTTPLPIALDEELIGIHTQVEKKQLLQTIQPQYIILKPTLHGGISGAQEWIALAEQLGIGWWVTSALESNIGLNAIAQWCASTGNPLPQGLGTGGLYTNNIKMPLSIRQDNLWFNPQSQTHLVTLRQFAQLTSYA